MTLSFESEIDTSGIFLAATTQAGVLSALSSTVQLSGNGNFSLATAGKEPQATYARTHHMMSVILVRLLECKREDGSS